jgi:hypothetical protein
MGLSRIYPWGQAPAFSGQVAALMIALPGSKVVKSGSMEFRLIMVALTLVSLTPAPNRQVIHTPCGLQVRTGPTARRAGW